MPERPCTVPKVFVNSSGRAICTPKWKARYLDQGVCDECPKVKGILPLRVPASKADRDAWAVRRGLGYS